LFVWLFVCFVGCQLLVCGRFFCWLLELANEIQSGNSRFCSQPRRKKNKKKFALTREEEKKHTQKHQKITGDFSALTREE